MKDLTLRFSPVQEKTLFSTQQRLSLVMGFLTEIENILEGNELTSLVKKAEVKKTVEEKSKRVDRAIKKIHEMVDKPRRKNAKVSDELIEKMRKLRSEARFFGNL